MKYASDEIKVFVIALVIGGCLFLSAISCKKSETETRAKKHKAKTEKQIQTEKMLQDLVKKHSAIVDWRQNIDQKNLGPFSPPIYTIQVEDALVRADDRPVMFIAKIEDIVRRDDKYLVNFSVSRMLNMYSNPYVRFILHCTQEQVNHIMNNHNGNNESFFLDHYAAIANISGVSKVSLQLTAGADRVISHDGEEFDVDISTSIEPSNIFVATGQCVDLLFVGDMAPNKYLGAGMK
jgi:hypothetical protein